MRELLQLVLMRTWRWIRKSFWPVLMRKWTWIRKTKNDIHSSDFDVFFSSPILFSNREENHIGMLRAELGYALIYTYFPPSWLQLL